MEPLREAVGPLGADPFGPCGRLDLEDLLPPLLDFQQGPARWGTRRAKRRAWPELIWLIFSSVFQIMHDFALLELILHFE